VSCWLRIWASGHLVKNKVLTVTGPYAYVKNPLYIGTLPGHDRDRVPHDGRPDPRLVSPGTCAT
jgi:hypothetical protein